MIHKIKEISEKRKRKEKHIYMAHDILKKRKT